MELTDQEASSRNAEQNAPSMLQPAAVSASQQVKQEMLALIGSQAFLTTGDYTVSLHKIVGPVDAYFAENAAFQSNCRQVADTIVLDRNGDCAFDMEDLELLVKDVPAMMELAKAIALLAVSFRELNLKYVRGTAEVLMLKLLMYIFVVVLPQQILASSLADPSSASGEPNPLSSEEQSRVVEIVMMFYSFIVNARVAKKVFKKVIAFFHKKAICICCTVYDDAEETTAAKLPTFIEPLRASVDKNREIVRLKKNLYNNPAAAACHHVEPQQEDETYAPQVVFHGDH